MFSHPRLPETGFTRIVPVETVIIDEASQIELGDYLPLFSTFGAGFKKIVFIGDNKQRKCSFTGFQLVQGTQYPTSFVDSGAIWSGRFA